jgi:integrase
MICDLTPELVRSWYAALQACDGWSVAAKAYTRFRQVLTRAGDDDRIARNPCRIQGGGAERHPEQQFISMEKIYQLAGEVPSRYRAMILLAGMAGLRQGELFALCRSDLDLLHAVVAVRRKRLRLASGVVIEDDPKSQAGSRMVALPGPLVTELEHHLLEFAADDGVGPESYVFTSPDGRPVEWSNFRHRVWLPAVAAAGLPGLRFHDLRHIAGYQFPNGSHHEGADGPTRARQPPCVAHLPARHRGSRPTDRQAPRRDGRRGPGVEALDRVTVPAAVGRRSRSPQRAKS